MRGEWLENIMTLPEEMQDKIIADIARYGTRQPTKYDDDPIVFSIVNGYKGRIDASIQEYEDKISMSKSAGRKKKELAAERAKDYHRISCSLCSDGYIR